MIGLDLAKNGFQIHGRDERQNAVFRKTRTLAQVLPSFANLPPCPLGWKPVGARIAGRESWNGWDTP